MKRFKAFAILIIIIGLGIWVACRWKIWFSNPEEARYVLSASPSKILLTFSDKNGMDRNISWSCDSTLHESFAEITDTATHKTSKVTAEGEIFRSRSGVGAYYHVKLTGLQKGHTYQYRVCTGNQYSKWYQFSMADKQNEGTAFLFVADVQDSINGITNQLLQRALSLNKDIEFMVSGGDLTERPTDAYWNETFRSIDSIAQAMPVLTITGNHDYLKGANTKLEHRFTLIHSYFLDSEFDDNQVYTMCYNNIQFFVLDSNRQFWHLYDQKKWLEKELAASKAKWKILLIHHPLYSIKGNNNLIQRWMFDDLIREYKVDLVLQGHEHAYARMTNHAGNGTASTPIYTVSHCSTKNYLIEFDDRFDKFGSQSRYYQKVKTDKDTLFVSAYDAYDNSLYDSMQIIKSGEKTTIVDLGKNIKEKINYTPKHGNKKEINFAERIKEYKKKHPERF